jgi:hypothetical protein
VHVIVWRFTTSEPAEFERHYHGDGTWAQLFRRSEDYIRTDLLRGDGEYLTLDWWTSRAAYDAFRADHAAAYAEIDRICEALTTSEDKLGEFTSVDGV